VTTQLQLINIIIIIITMNGGLFDIPSATGACRKGNTLQLGFFRAMFRIALKTWGFSVSNEL
jgi:hypothetical protein